MKEVGEISEVVNEEAREEVDINVYTNQNVYIMKHNPSSDMKYILYMI